MAFQVDFSACWISIFLVSSRIDKSSVGSYDLLLRLISFGLLKDNKYCTSIKKEWNIWILIDRVWISWSLLFIVIGFLSLFIFQFLILCMMMTNSMVVVTFWIVLLHCVIIVVIKNLGICQDLKSWFFGGELWRADQVKMPRRAADYRRPVRRRLSQWIWALLVMFLIAGLVLFVFQHHHDEDQVNQTLQVMSLSFCCW